MCEMKRQIKYLQLPVKTEAILTGAEALVDGVTIRFALQSKWAVSNSHNSIISRFIVSVFRLSTWVVNIFNCRFVDEDLLHEP